MNPQDIKDIENLEDCLALERLILVENRIKKIKGVEHLTNLKELHLYSNRIVKIENLQALEQLEVGCMGLAWPGTPGDKNRRPFVHYCIFFSAKRLVDGVMSNEEM